MNHFIKNGIRYKDGDKVLSTIKNTFVFATLSITDSHYHLCHDNERFNGSRASNLKGHTYSWVFDPFYDNSDVKILQHIDESNRQPNIKITNYIYDQIDKGLSLVLFDRDIFKEYSILNFSPTTGFFRLSNESNRFVDIKIGRFLSKTISEAVKQNKKLYNTYTNSSIENLTNNLIKLQENKNIQIEYFTGKKILDGYKKSNHVSTQASLNESCMNDKPDDILELYTDNPNIVSMMVIKDFTKIIGRALVWNVNGKKIVDKQYVAFGWVNCIIDEEITKNGYEKWSSKYAQENPLSIKLNKDTYSKYPYLDTFKYLYDGTLYNKIQAKCKILNSTVGGYESR